MFKVGDKPVPGYRLVRAIGRGQYGEVWETEAPGGARVALKFIPLQSKSGSVEVRAVQAVKRIRHANLVPVNAIWVLDQNGDVLDDDAINKIATKPAQHSLEVDQFKFSQNLAYLVIAMALADESLEGILKERIEEGQQGIPRDELVEYMRQAAKGIDFLNEPRHEVDGKLVGITHRDVKPANLLLIGNSVVVGDFGVATTLKEFDATATNVVGSLGFMAPESIAQKPSPATDQYALAITYYRLRTGGLPYDETVSVDKLIEIHRAGKLAFRGVPRDEQTILQKATSQKPTDRYQNCIEFVAALQELANPKSTTQQSSTNWAIPVAIGVAVIGLVALFIWQPWNNNDNNNVVENGKDNPDKNNGNENGDGTGNGKVPVVPEIPERNIRFLPDGIEYSVVVVTKDGEESTPLVGLNQTSIRMADDSTLRVSAKNHGPLYQPMTDQVFSLGDLENADMSIRLVERSTEDIRKEVFEKIENGDAETAIKLLKEVSNSKPEILNLEPMALEIEGRVDKAQFASDSNQLVMAVTKSQTDAESNSNSTLTSLQHIEDITQALDPQDATGNGATGQLVEQLFYSTNSQRWLICRSDSIWSWQPHQQDDSFINLWKYTTDVNDRIRNCDLSDNGEWLVAGDNAGVVRILNITTGGAALAQIKENVHDDEIVDAVRFFGAGKTLSTVSIDFMGVAKLCTNFTAGPGNEKFIDLNFDAIDEDEEYSAFAKIDNTTFALATDAQLYMGKIDGEAAPLTKMQDLADGASLMRASKTGKWLAVATNDPANALLVFDTQSSEKTIQFESNQISTAYDVAFSQDESIMAIATHTGSLYAVELSNPTPTPIEITKFGNAKCDIVRFLPGTDTVCVFAVSPDTKKSFLEVWDIKKAIAFAQARTAE